ncbi:MAG TPA: TlpA disulfide reductase family protein [Dongiaceae bacterium]|jgi:thiol-disulfide isomerase/thioredoxin|nr:TlpA disulfide reductase family protein [Dongiaceae bacterium]
MTMRRLALVLCALALAPAMPVRAQDAPQGLVLHEAPKPVIDLSFQDEAGKPRYLADFHGKLVVLNLWATWCIPCRAEMPTLDRLQGRLGGPKFEVVALSIDRAGMKAVDPFFRQAGITHIARYLDTGGEAAGHLGVLGLPSTLLIDPKGQELGRLVGPAEWDSAEMVAFLRKLVAGQSAP